MDNLKILLQLLGTTVIATIISSLFAYYKSKKDNTLSYIVEERKAWRDTLRGIIKNLNEIEFSETTATINGKSKLLEVQRIVSELECRINPRGLVENKDSDVDLDTHIWKKLDNIYGYENDEELSKSGDIKKLRRYISVLLKYDWERTKKEVKGSSFASLIKILDIISIILFGYLSYTSNFKEAFTKSFKNVESMSSSILYIILFLLLFILLFFPYESFETNAYLMLAVTGQLFIYIIFFVSITCRPEFWKTSYFSLGLALVMIQLVSCLFKLLISFSFLKKSVIDYKKLIDKIDV